MTNLLDKNIKVGFFGTSSRTSEILDALNSSFTLTFCLTKTDSKVGRDQKLTPTGVKTWCTNNQVPCYEVTDLKNDNKNTVLKIIGDTQPKFIIVADFSFIIPEEIINNDVAQLLNLHFSLLPKYRGASPVQFAILNGDKQTGITIQKIHQKMDRGDIICQIPLDIELADTSETLYKKMFSIAADKLPEVLVKYNLGTLAASVQDETHATYTSSKTNPKTTQILKDDAKIDWTQSNKKIYDLIRSMYPWPIAWTTLAELAAHLQKIPLNPESGTKRVKIINAHYESDKLIISRLQIEGSKETNLQGLINGYLK